MGPSSRDGDSKFRTRSARYGAVVVLLGLFVASGQSPAWADNTTTGSDSHQPSVTHSESTTGTNGAADDKKSPPASTTDESKTADSKDTDPSSTVTTGTPTDAGESDLDASDPPKVEPTTTPTAVITAPLTDSKTADSKTADSKTADSKTADSKSTVTAAALRAPASTPTTDVDGSSALATDPLGPVSTDPAPAARSLVAVTTASPTAASTLRTAAVDIAPPTPAPLSPIAQIVALPGQIVNAVLQLVGITTAADTGPAPISPAPIADLVFAVFRRIEHAIGLDAPVSVPTPPSLVYTGPETGDTPTVAQFLNAATTEYVLGGAPGGLAPLTVDGWQMSRTDLFSGMNAKVWVTPEKQVIIAYSGTTGGTNLLFNPLIAISQILTDTQGGFSNTTPTAFDQALDFADQVRAEAAKQGYAPEDVFVTGHSLGAWEAQYVAQQTGLGGIGFEGPGLSTTVPGNGAKSMFVNTATYGDIAAYLSSDLPGLYPFVPYPYVPAGGLHPHYGPIVMLGDPNSNTPMVNAANLWGKSIVGSLIAAVDLLGNFFASHLPGVQAYNLDVTLDPGVVPWLGIKGGTVYTGYGDLTIPEFLKAASDKGILVTP